MAWQNGSTLNIDLNVEKIPVSFSMDENGVITMTNADGTTYTADIGSLIKTYNFVDSDQIDFTATLQPDGSYNVTGIIKDGSITDAMLESGYLASVTAQASSASTSSQNATAKATLAESYAKGGTNTRTGEDTDNAKYYSDRASALVDVDIATTSKAGIVKPDGTTITVDGNGLINALGGHTHSNKATLDSITENDLINWNAKADIDDIPVIATTSAAGIVKPDGTTITVDANGVITATSIYDGVAHNGIYRGKNLGTSVTAEQYAAISAGTFDDLYIGDYWTIGGVNYRIAAFDYYWNCGDNAVPPHHAVIVPEKNLYNAVMNDTDTTTGGYFGSQMHITNLEQAKTTIKAAFSGHVVNHRIYLVNAVANGYSSGGVWVDSEVDLMNEQMVYGSGIFSPVSAGSAVPANYRVEKNQLPLFAMNTAMSNTRELYWLRDVITAYNFAYVGNNGNADYANSSASIGVRPAFCIS